MKSKFTRLVYTTLFYVIFQSFSVPIIAQSCDCTISCQSSIKALPKMWVNRELAEKRKNQFMTPELSVNQNMNG